MTTRTPFTEDPAANELLTENPTALMIGMLLDQQFPMERAFASPYVLQERLGTPLDPSAIASLDEGTLVSHFQGPPALHRFPGSMAKRAKALCEAIVEDYDGDTASVWTSAADGRDLLKRLKALPGFGDAKARIFIGVLGKRLGAAPDEWEDVAADWPSIADVDEFDKVYELREKKKAMKAAAKKADS